MQQRIRFRRVCELQELRKGYKRTKPEDLQGETYRHRFLNIKNKIKLIEKLVETD